MGNTTLDIGNLRELNVPRKFVHLPCLKGRKYRRPALSGGQRGYAWNRSSWSRGLRRRLSCQFIGLEQRNSWDSSAWEWGAGGEERRFQTRFLANLRPTTNFFSLHRRSWFYDLCVKLHLPWLTRAMFLFSGCFLGRIVIVWGVSVDESRIPEWVLFVQLPELLENTRQVPVQSASKVLTSYGFRIDHFFSGKRSL